jgi:hypothetical protein
MTSRKIGTLLLNGMNAPITFGFGAIDQSQSGRK